MSLPSEQPPKDIYKLAEWLTRMITLINGVFDQMHDLPVSGSYPNKPRNGMIRYFNFIDGTITSKGFWGYEEGVWVKL